jgi:hypothetical protein
MVDAAPANGKMDNSIQKTGMTRSVLCSEKYVLLPLSIADSQPVAVHAQNESMAIGTVFSILYQVSDVEEVWI